jgi:probable phosphoglycerate mutase
MKYTAEALGMGYTIEDWLREMYPELWIKDTPWGEVPAFQIPGEAYRAGTELPSHSSWYNTSILKDKGVRESVELLRNNSDAFLGKLGYERKDGLYRCIRRNYEQVAIFCHAGLALTWLAILLEIPMTLMWSGFWLPPSSVTTILFEENSQEWAVPRCIGLGDISHLYEARLKESTIGLMANLI